MARSTVPYLGRTVRIVGPVVNVDTEDTPHPMVARGEMGKALLYWRNNRISRDPLKRVATVSEGEDLRNTFSSMLGKLNSGAVNPDQMVVDDPAAMTAHIKKVARHFGASIVGVGASHPSFFYAGGRFLEDETVDDPSMRDPAALARRFPYLIAVPVALDYDLIQAHRHILGDLAYGIADQKIALVLESLEHYIHELGYQAVKGAIVPQAGAIAAGIGELGRNGMVISKDYGPRFVLQAILSTDLPLVPDTPPDLGVEDFCKICRKCATTCPTNSITFEDKVIWNGVEKYKINWETCYKLRPYFVQDWSVCLTCITICPYTKPDTWWRSAALGFLRHTPMRLRPLSVHLLKWLDDRIFGTIANKRVRWLGYDSGVKPGEKACTIPGCTASHVQDEAGVASTRVELSKKADRSRIGYYSPLKENTNRFTKRA